VDLPKEGWCGRASEREAIDGVAMHTRAYWSRYGKHASFYGWYLNYEINPLAPEEREQSRWWRTVWREQTAECHRVAPRLQVFISPFFILGKNGRNGIKYLAPQQYADWWRDTLRETKIDVVMLQDSGAEHASFFTLADREPFFAAMQAACRDAGARLWLNVETGEKLAANWDEFAAIEREQRVLWRFTPIDHLAAKLELAARYGEEIVNWGYFPFMMPNSSGVQAACGSKTFHQISQPGEAYQQYRAYYQRWQEKNK
jgi:hypothetical protein